MAIFVKFLCDLATVNWKTHIGTHARAHTHIHTQTHVCMDGLQSSTLLDVKPAYTIWLGENVIALASVLSLEKHRSKFLLH